MSTNIGIVGTGYVGLVQGTCFAATGNNVLCVDIDARKVEMLRKGEMPIFEPGLEHLLRTNIAEGRLKFTTDLEAAVMHSDILFLCLPTPPNEDGSADLHHLLDVAEDIARIVKKNNITKHLVLVNKSTVPVGTADKVTAVLQREIPDKDVEIASNPEFLREGVAVEDAMKPDRVVVGITGDRAKKIFTTIYEPFLRNNNPLYFMDLHSAELTKYAANAFLSVKISFMNELSEYCERIGADVEKIRAGIGSDNRIGKSFLYAGLGYGGSCFPKDVRAIMHSSEAEGINLEIIQAAHRANLKQQLRFFDIIKNRMGDLKGKKFAVWGLSFKPNTDDTRESPAFTLIDRFLEEGASIIAYDPEAIENSKIKYGDKIEYAKDMYAVLEGAEALILATEWTVFRRPNFDALKEKLKNAIIFDGRNQYDLQEMKELGFEYHCIGRK